MNYTKNVTVTYANYGQDQFEQDLKAIHARTDENVLPELIFWEV
ncbi:hypothetical protein [Thermoactinomyces mirandus]|nr:hypothetical protein [Thermoactinomyces mirandus]